MHNLVLLRQRRVSEKSGDPRSTLYERIADGTFVPGVKIGPAAVGWPAHEVDQIIAARIAGKSSDEIKELVRKLVEDRQKLPALLLGKEAA